MDHLTIQLAERLKKNPAILHALMQSADGKALMQRLTQADRGAELQKAAQAAAQGDTAQLSDMIRAIMSSPDGAALIARINQAIK